MVPLTDHDHSPCGQHLEIIKKPTNLIAFAGGGSHGLLRKPLRLISASTVGTHLIGSNSRNISYNKYRHRVNI